METNQTLLAGFAEFDITPEPGLTLLGQMHRRVAERARDPLMANAMALRSQDETMVLISVDICLLVAAFIEETQKLFAQRTGLPPERLLLHATHTHVAPSVVSDLFYVDADPAFIERLREAIVETAERALSRLEPVAAFSGIGHMEQMGWNRRAMFADGTSKMYGHADMPGFIGMEGPRDPALNVLFTRNASGAIMGVLVNFSTHPNAIEAATVYSADIPGAARRTLKQLLGKDVVMVYLTGAAGNTAPSILDPFSSTQPWRGDEGLERSGFYLGGEAAKVIAATIEPMDSPTLRLEQRTLSIPLRPWPKPDEPTYPRWGPQWGEPLIEYYQHAEEVWPRRLAEENPVPVRLNVLRVGDTAICTNPAEFFVEFGLEIRQISPARVTMVSELTDGYVGYVPTKLALSRGGYETWIAPSSQLVPEAGEQMVQTTGELLGAAFSRGSSSSSV